MFENITKGVWSIDEDKTNVNEYGVTEISLRVDLTGSESPFNNVIVYEPDGKTVNAEFIAYCFNLQQRFDIGKLEEAIKLLDFIFDIDICDVRTDKKLNLLLTKIKKKVK